MHKDISALIAVRKGSKRIPNKNIRSFAKSSLLEIKIKQLLRVKGINNIYVSTDCEEMFTLAKDLGAIVEFRDSYYTSDRVPNERGVRTLNSFGRRQTYFVCTCY